MALNAAERALAQYRGIATALAIEPWLVVGSKVNERFNVSASTWIHATRIKKT